MKFENFKTNSLLILHVNFPGAFQANNPELLVLVLYSWARLKILSFLKVNDF